jgi:N-acetylneuraminic acid mutarotase
VQPQELRLRFLFICVIGFFYLPSLTTIIYTDYHIYSYAQDNQLDNNAFWSTGAPLPTPRSEIAGAALNGKIYIIGGFDETGQSTTTIEVYDPIADKWTEAAPLPQPLDHTAAASYDGRLYVVGGGYLSRGTLSDKLFIYDPIPNKWTEGSKLPTARGALTANFINGTLYTVGGIDSLGTSNSNRAYDPRTNMWTERAPMPTNKGTSNLCCSR